MKKRTTDHDATPFLQLVYYLLLCRRSLCAVSYLVRLDVE